MKPIRGIAKAWMKVGGFVKKQRDNIGFARLVIEFAEFVAKLTPSKKDDKFVEDLKKMINKADSNLSKVEAVKAKAEEVVKKAKKKK